MPNHSQSNNIFWLNNSRQLHRVVATLHYSGNKCWRGMKISEVLWEHNIHFRYLNKLLRGRCIVQLHKCKGQCTHASSPVLLLQGKMYRLQIQRKNRFQYHRLSTLFGMSTAFRLDSLPVMYSDFLNNIPLEYEDSNSFLGNSSPQYSPYKSNRNCYIFFHWGQFDILYHIGKCSLVCKDSRTSFHWKRYNTYLDIWFECSSLGQGSSNCCCKLSTCEHYTFECHAGKPKSPLAPSHCWKSSMFPVYLDMCRIPVGKHHKKYRSCSLLSPYNIFLQGRACRWFDWNPCNIPLDILASPGWMSGSWWKEANCTKLPENSCNIHSSTRPQWSLCSHSYRDRFCSTPGLWSPGMFLRSKNILFHFDNNSQLDTQCRKFFLWRNRFLLST